MNATSFLLALICFFVVVGLASAGFSHESLVEEINGNPHAGWKADDNADFFSRFRGEEKRFHRLLGVRSSGQRLPQVSHEERGVSPAMVIPESFDARNAWAGCIGAIRDQGECGSCWAFGGVEALSDRFCIASNGTTNVTLAPLDPVTCDSDNDGCQGGDPGSLWTYMKSSGVVMESCAPYNDSIPTCPPAQEPCLNFVNTPQCKKTCKNGGSWSSSKHFAKSAYSIQQNVADIQQEIMTNGPVEAAFDVYKDFLAYKSGVYKHVSGDYLGGHAVKIIGWGVDSSTNQPYWTIANSWTTTWGADGYFLMLRGKNECGIEDDIVAGLPKV